MSRVCEICEKSSQKGNRITIAWGVKYRSIKHRKPNLRKTTLLIDGKPTKSKVCSTCLKSVKNKKVPGITYPIYFVKKGSRTVTEGKDAPSVEEKKTSPKARVKPTKAKKETKKPSIKKKAKPIAKKITKKTE